MYADLIDEQGNSVVDRVVVLNNGASAGTLYIPAELEPGNYMLRAFTDFQKQIGEKAFYYKPLRISKLESFIEEAAQEEPIISNEIYLDFLPEGGMLLEGHMNTLALKATDAHGKGVPVQGEILDSKGVTVTTFETSFKGMTSFAFSPVKSENYSARMHAYPDLHHSFNDIVKEGMKIEFEKEERDDLHFRVISNASSFIGRTYYFAISHHGEVIFYKKFVPKKETFPITVNKDALPAGINRMVLMDEQLLPLSERLYFSSNYQINEIKIKADKQAYDTRSRVSLRLSDGKEMAAGSWSNLSMTVVDDFAGNKEGPSGNILSWLLINSELKGLIESPLDYFSDDPKLTSASKLDLLMLTQGWSRYVWNSPEKFLARKAKDKEGFAVSGEVHKVIGNKPVTEGTVELKIYNNNFMHMDEVELGNDGRFVFKDVSFMDSASVFVQARNKRDKLAYGVSLNPVFKKFPNASTVYFPIEGTFAYKQAEQYQRQYDKLQALKEYTLKSGSFYLEEVTITGHKRDPDDGHFRIYPKPSNSTEITERDVTYPNIIAYMQGRFAGVTVDQNYNISIRGPSSFGASPALLILDGFPVSKDVFLSIPMHDIDRVEVLKNPGETAIFGTRGGAGVVSVFTKKGGFLTTRICIFPAPLRRN